MVLGFGLIHGLGLSARIKKIQLPAMPQMDLIERIVAFNVGVELGQIAALIVMVAVLAIWRRLGSFPVFAKAANSALMIAGSLLFLFQMHGWLHTTWPDDYGFSRDVIITTISASGRVEPPTSGSRYAYARGVFAMKNIIRTLCLGMALGAGAAATANAHPGHGLEMEMTPRELAVSSAQYVVTTMIQRNVLDAELDQY
jgi:hypothetical protein